jgi:hypothetical protein
VLGLTQSILPIDLALEDAVSIKMQQMHGPRLVLQALTPACTCTELH